MSRHDDSIINTKDRLIVHVVGLPPARLITRYPRADVSDPKTEWALPGGKFATRLQLEALASESGAIIRESVG